MFLDNEKDTRKVILLILLGIAAMINICFGTTGYISLKLFPILFLTINMTAIIVFSLLTFVSRKQRWKLMLIFLFHGYFLIGRVVM